uniref:Uncharacterized protein n=1 Tax=Anguilla anguilla TaxID=7936 RepID=A0A0E9PLR1_ANGAN
MNNECAPRTSTDSFPQSYKHQAPLKEKNTGEI